MRVVLDTNVVISGLRSPLGASAELLRRVLRGRIAIALSTPLLLEYEAAALRTAQRRVSGLSEADVSSVLDALAAQAVRVTIHYRWRPTLRDPSDEMVLETAVNAGADLIVTYNQKDFEDAPRRFGVAVARPLEVLERLRS